MRGIGEVFKLKTSLEEIKAELTPSFDEVIRSSLGHFVGTRFKSPVYVLENTYPTDPLILFFSKVVENLQLPTVKGISLLRGFGFGKTHALILLWHLFTDEAAAKSELALKAKLDPNIPFEILVLGFDFSRENPLARMFDILEGISAGKPVSKFKDPRLVESVRRLIGGMSRADALAMTSDKFTELILDILEGFKKRGGTPRLLLLADEVGLGIVSRLMKYVESWNEEIYAEILKTLYFLNHLYTNLSGRGIPGLIIWALAEQDLRELENLRRQHLDKPEFISKIEGIKGQIENLRERLGRATGKVEEEIGLSYSYEHALEIAKHRIFGGEGDADAFLSSLGMQAEQFNIKDEFEKIKGDLKKNYPLSPGMIRLLKKAMNNLEAPGTEYIRTILYLVAEASENAFHLDPYAPMVSVKHLELSKASLFNLMGEFQGDWFGVIADVEQAIRSAEPEHRELVELVSKEVLSKGTTANVFGLMEAKEARELERYGISPEEMQLDILASFPSNKAADYVGKLSGSLEFLKAQSARIEEREAQGKRYLLPSLSRTVYDKLAAFITEERRILENEAQIPAYLSDPLNKLFDGLKVPIAGREEGVAVILTGWGSVADPEALLANSNVREAQREGKASIIIVPPWDEELFRELYRRGRSYEELINVASGQYQEANLKGKIEKPLHLILLIPDISKGKLTHVLEDVISYKATQKFINSLEKKEQLVAEKFRDYEGILLKRLPLGLFEEQRRRLEREIKHLVERQVGDAKASAQKEFISITRRIAVDALELYEKGCFYRLQTQSFEVEDLMQMRKEPGGETERLEGELGRYTAIMNKFFEKLIEALGFVWEPTALEGALLKHYEEEFTLGAKRKEEDIASVVENLLLGTYEVKPLSKELAQEAVKALDKNKLKAGERTIEIEVAENKLKFREEKEEVEEEEEGEKIEIGGEEGGIDIITIPETIRELKFEVGAGFNVSEFTSKLKAFLETYGTLLREAIVKVEGEAVEATFKFLGETHQPEVIGRVINFLKPFSESYKDKVKPPRVILSLKEPVPKEKAQEIFGTYFKEEKPRGSWDELLS